MVRLLGLVLLAQHFEVVSDCGGALAPPVNDPPGRQLAMGPSQGCALEAGAVRCWGENTAGQLGRGDVSAFEVRAAPVPLDEAIAQIVTGGRSSCARTVTGRVLCWGDNAAGQLGRLEPASSPTPLEVSVPVPVAQLALRSDFVLALGSDGRLFGWGNDSEGTLGRDDPHPGTWPSPRGVVRAAFAHRFKAVTAGQGHACGVDLEGGLWCWGRNTRQELGASSSEQQHRAPVKVLENVSAVAAGAFGTCAISGGELWCWSDFPIDDVLVIKAPTPVRQDLDGRPVRMVDESWFHICAVTSDDRLFCWGRGIEGQLGLGALDPSSVPREVMSGVESVSTGSFFTCLRRTDGTVACMGANESGQLGLGDTNRRAVPTLQ